MLQHRLGEGERVWADASAGPHRIGLDQPGPGVAIEPALADAILAVTLEHDKARKAILFSPGN